MSVKSLKLALKEDKIYCQHANKIARIEMKDETWADEIESLHARRDIRALNSTSLLQSAQKISLDNNIDNQVVRSRCVEIKLRALKQEITYQKSLKFLRKYIPARFSTELKSFKTITERKAAIDYVLNPISECVDKLKFVVDIADIVIDDCDQAGFTLKRINETLEQRRHDK